MRFYLTCGILMSGLLLGPIHANAGDLSYVPPGGSEEVADAAEDAMNYFSSGQHKKEEMLENIDGVPQSELENLPDTINVQGRTKIKVRDGELISNTDAVENYIDCDNAPLDENGNKPDGCMQKLGAEAPITQDKVMDEPQTLDQQLQNKEMAGDSMESNTNNIEETSIVDKKRGAKTNIISNTDTGVKLAE